MFALLLSLFAFCAPIACSRMAKNRPRKLAEDGYSGVEVRRAPSHTEVIIMATRNQSVLGERIRVLTALVQKRFGYSVGQIEETTNVATSLSAVQQTVPIKRTVVTEKTIFSGLKFVLTSATRPNKKVTDFNKRDYRKKIEERGGRIIEDFTHPLASDETAYLIADTYYRTHKYLSALSLSIPCVSYKWIQQCVAEKQLTDHQPFLLPAGESSLDTKKQFEWRPLKGVLMKGKRVLIWSSSAESDPGIVSFAEIWTPILQNLGATLVGIGPGEPFASKSSANLEEKMEFCSKSTRLRRKCCPPTISSSRWLAKCRPRHSFNCEEEPLMMVMMEWEMFN
ncbi:hypothetical protein niasHT_024567 [Heterodera trifolii]|uniref:BRCT domain-containing protein n=1 Tax=Heterodera trifolii TaxID=157864 RepID=A0ABD2K7X2_9BILA